MSKIKLLVIIQKDPLGEGIGGIHTFNKGLIRCLPDDFEIEMVGITTDKIKRPVGRWKIIKFGQKKINFLPVLYTCDQNKKGKIPLSLRFELSLFRYKSKISLKDRILVFHRPEPAILFNRVRNRKIVYIHGNVEDLYNPHSEKKWRSMPWLYFQMEKRVMKNMDKIFVVSKKGLNFYRKRYKYIKSRFSFVPTWVDKNIFYPLQSGLDKKDEIKRLLGKFHISSNDKVLLFAGRLEGQKNPLLLIDSFNKLCSMDTNVKLLIVGGGDLIKRVLGQINKYRLEEKVNLLGILPQDKLAELMRICDVFILTSAYEGMPMVVIEALASGLPVVSTDEGEVKRVVRDGYSGFSVPKHNAADIADAVMQILKNKEKFGVYNCLDSIKDYSMDIVLNDIYKKYRSLANDDK